MTFNLISISIPLKYGSDLHHHLLGDVYRDAIMSQSSHRGAYEAGSEHRCQVLQTHLVGVLFLGDSEKKKNNFQQKPEPSRPADFTVGPLQVVQEVEEGVPVGLRAGLEDGCHGGQARFYLLDVCSGE